MWTGDIQDDTNWRGCPPSCHPVCTVPSVNPSIIVKATSETIFLPISTSLSWPQQTFCQRILHFKVYLDACNSNSCKMYLVRILFHGPTKNYIRRVIGMMLLLTHYCARRHCASILFLFAGCAAFLLLNLQRNPTHCSVQTSCCLQWGDWVGCIVLITLCNPIFLL